MDDPTPFHMVRLWLESPGLTTVGKMNHLPLSQTSTLYLAHCALKELFGDRAPKPFHVENGEDSGRYVRVLGYAGADSEALESEARIGTDPTIYDICDWDRLRSKPMPESFPEGMQLSFEVRACPIVRKSSAGEGPNGREWREGQELDAFLSRAWENPDEELTREGVYRDWLIRQFEVRGGAAIDPESVGMSRFSIERMVRRTHGDDRSVNVIKRPDVTLHGTLEVTDSDTFRKVLRSGVGGHKTFGYGMLKVQRA
ncbi:type I-E CRISPR-associated protein Cas6/Cse3/CasE [Salinibacter ruber]|uniref:type I-E CRISPR-associated protein Cas6/Cse3/CasE n=2 Tax=Salinibacter ruber TaxID=146919 RepID=UPI0020734D49|nr:type I-E CRISPR-associated protein Cas6/Cse3/CasE [Salinibacter ruber]